jgi:beta-N-acetylhexosaminidase
VLAASAVALAGPSSGAVRAPAPTLSQLIGQKLVVSMNGTTPSASLLRRVRTGHVGGVLIHGYNFSSGTQLRAITHKLRAAATAGGQPPLLIAVDQEGGPVKTVPGAPPTISPRRMGELNSTATASSQGKKTGAALLDRGVNLDFAPVADVPSSPASFIYRQGRTWSFSTDRTSRLANAFATGLRNGHALATMKHFPGLGRATENTDTHFVTIRASKAQLANGLVPYRRAVANHVPLVMLSNAVYTAYDRSHAAGWSRTIGTKLLRWQLGFKGVTITDSLDGAAHTRGVTDDVLALKAAKAGTDMLLLTGSEAASSSVYLSLVRAAQAGEIRHDRLGTSYNRIAALKAGL